MQLALTDPLTGLGNHRSFHERLQRELAQAERERHDAEPLPRRHRRLQERQRPLRPPGRRPRARAGRLATAPGRRELPARRRRVRRAAARVSTSRNAVAVARSIVERVGAARARAGRLADRERGRRDVPDPGCRPRRADPARRLRALLGEGRRQEPRAHVRGREDRARAAAAARGLARTGPRATAQPRRLAKAVDARDAYTGSHSERVGELAARIARRLGSDESQIELTRLAASLHDLGKLAIPEEILRKPSELNESERLVLQRHPQIGYRMLESLGVEPIAEWVLHHHERWDGDGYPDRLRGEEIPLGARIIFVADAYDAMTSERVYRKPLSPREALEELERCSGSQFDPQIVEAFSEELGVRPRVAELATLRRDVLGGRRRERGDASACVCSVTQRHRRARPLTPALPETAKASSSRRAARASRRAGRRAAPTRGRVRVEADHAAAEVVRRRELHLRERLPRPRRPARAGEEEQNAPRATVTWTGASRARARRRAVRRRSAAGVPSTSAPRPRARRRRRRRRRRRTTRRTSAARRASVCPASTERSVRIALKPKSPSTTPIPMIVSRRRDSRTCATPSRSARNPPWRSPRATGKSSAGASRPARRAPRGTSTR